MVKFSDFPAYYILAAWLMEFLLGALNIEDWADTFDILVQHAMTRWSPEGAEGSAGRVGN